MSKDLPYPSGTPGAGEIADQVYFVNHFYAVKNFSYVHKGRRAAVVVNRAPGGRVTGTTVDRYLNNDYHDGVIKARDLAVFRAGKLKGTAILTTVFEDEDRSQAFSVWLPALRKIRRHAEPSPDDSWGGSNLTYGDVYLRRPRDETHILLGTETFDGCLGAMELGPGQGKRYLRNLPAVQCGHRGRRVYRLRSATRFKDWWYDYRVRYIDARTFADYRAIYLKGDTPVKIIDKDWQGMGLDDPRAQYWRYWYARTVKSGQEGLAAVPDAIVHWNSDYPPSLWSEKTLRRIKR